MFPFSARVEKGLGDESVKHSPPAPLSLRERGVKISFKSYMIRYLYFIARKVGITPLLYAYRRGWGMSQKPIINYFIYY